MTQAATLVADKLNESNAWFRSDNGQSTNVYQMIDEGYPGNDSTDYAGWNEAGSAPGKRMVFKWTTINTPANGNVTLKVRHYANSTTEVRTYEIRQGYVDESTLGTLLGSTTITHTQFATWESSTPTVAITGATDGSDLYLRVWVSTFGGATLSAITAIDADFPDAQVVHNLSGTPDILATTPLATDGGTTKVSWQLTDGAPQLTTITGDGTMTTAQGHHELTDGAPQLTAITGSGSGRAAWILTGSPELTSITGAGLGGFGPLHLSGSVQLYPLIRAIGLGIKIASQIYDTFAIARAAIYEFTVAPTRFIVDAVPYGRRFKVRSYIPLQDNPGGDAQSVRNHNLVVLAEFDLLNPADYAANPDPTVPQTGAVDTEEPKVNADFLSPAADAVNAAGDRTVRIPGSSEYAVYNKHGVRIA